MPFNIVFDYFTLICEERRQYDFVGHMNLRGQRVSFPGFPYLPGVFKCEADNVANRANDLRSNRLAGQQGHNLRSDEFGLRQKSRR